MVPISISNGDRILIEARRWKGTPWHHNQKCRGVGVDCVRFIEGVFKDGLGIEFGNIGNYARMPEGDSLLSFMKGLDCLTEIPLTEISRGDLLLFRLGKIPYHVGISNGQGMIHADSHFGVVEINNLGRWEQRLIAGFRVIGN